MNPSPRKPSKTKKSEEPPTRARARRVNFHYKQVERTDMCGGSWIDSATLSRTARGVFGVVARKYVEREDGSGGKHWETGLRESGLRDVGKIAAAIVSTEDAFDFTFDQIDVVERLASFDWLIAALVARSWECELPALPPYAELVRQRSYRRMGRVEVAIEWYYEWHRQTLSFDEWLRMLVGKEDVARLVRESYDGKRQVDEWCFSRGRLRVSYDDGGEHFEGPLTAAASIAGPKINGIDLAQLTLEALELDE